MATTDLFVRDKISGEIHRVGSREHDAMWVDGKGIVHYQNLQNGDGASGDGKNENNGYEFVRSNYGKITEEKGS